jgi:uncharacterized protein YjiS (DUF1127 family)
MSHANCIETTIPVAETRVTGIRPFNLASKVRKALEWMRFELQLRSDLRRIQQFDAHLLRDIGLHDTDLERAMRFGRR